MKAYDLIFDTMNASKWKLNKLRALNRKKQRARVLVSCDWLDPEVPVEWLADLLKLVRQTTNIDWLLLTKRPELWLGRVEKAMECVQEREMAFTLGTNDNELLWLLRNWIQGHASANVLIGTTVEDQRRADERIPELLKIPARVRFLSCEPLLGPVDLTRVEYQDEPGVNRITSDTHSRHLNALLGYTHNLDHKRIHWIITGGESGPGSRPMHPDWARSLRDQCQAAVVPFFFKQWGEWLPSDQQSATGCLCHDMDGQIHTWPQAKPIGPPHYGMNYSMRIGKHRAGRMLDGLEWNEFPSYSCEEPMK